MSFLAIVGVLLFGSINALASSFLFTYLDCVDASIKFEPIMYKNQIERDGGSYSLFASNETVATRIPGYEGKRCIIEEELARALSRIQNRLAPLGLSLKVYDAYRPQQAVDYFTQWTSEPDTFLAKKFHYPSVQKKDFHDLSYLSRTSSHTKGTAVDITLCKIGENQESVPSGFLGIWDSESLDMGTGYLCFDLQAHIGYRSLTKEQLLHRELLRSVMTEEGFVPLDTEMWHFYYKPERNPDHYYNFPIRDDYPVYEGKILLCASSEDEENLSSRPESPHLPMKKAS
jgi:zinc D-Ala-D-Ala dipeptidase